MLCLVLLRHAKSSWDDISLDDFDRPLNDRGRAAAPLMGHAIREIGLRPDVVLCSPAARTRQTLELITGVGFACPKSTVFEDDLYMASTEHLFARIRQIEPGPKTVMLIGHNPGLHGLALLLAGTGNAKSLSRLEDKYPTGALAVFSFEQTVWRDIAPATGHLEAYMTPRDRA
jgi:phosphohistidine phosphatase